MYNDMEQNVNTPPELNNEFVTVEIGTEPYIIGIEYHDRKVVDCSVENKIFQVTACSHAIKRAIAACLTV